MLTSILVGGAGWGMVTIGLGELFLSYEDGGSLKAIMALGLGCIVISLSDIRDRFCD